MTVDEALAALGLSRAASKAQVEGALRDRYRQWSNRVSTAPTPQGRQEATMRVAELDDVRKVLKDWDGGTPGSAPTAVPSSGWPANSPSSWGEPSSPTRGFPTVNQTPTAPRAVPAPSAPRPLMVPGWTIDAQNRWVCDAHSDRDCRICYHPGREQSVARSPKSKGVAIVLALIFGPLAWVYTYQRDKGKFWWTLGLTLISGGLWLFVAYPWVIIEACVRSATFYERYPHG